MGDHRVETTSSDANEPEMLGDNQDVTGRLTILEDQANATR